MSVETRRPRIGITVSLEAPDPDRNLFRNKRLQYLEEGMIDAVREAGAVPVLLPVLDEASADEQLEICDGLLLSGGSDVAPESYGEAPLRPEWGGDRRRDLYEFALYHAALSRRMPTLGICRGAQVLAVAHGGRLWQDLGSEAGAALEHRNPELYDRLEHDIDIVPDTRLAEILAPGRRRVNSVHHQAVRECVGELRVSARAEDGTIEAVEAVDDEFFVLGVQWHPEWRAGPRPLVEAFVQASARS